MEKEQLVIDMDYLAETVKSYDLARKMTKDEIEELFYAIQEDLNWWVIRDAAEKVIAFNDFLKRNKKAETRPIHYKVLSRNLNAFRNDYSLMFTGRSENDAQHFIEEGLTESLEEWKIVLVENGMETEIRAGSNV